MQAHRKLAGFRGESSLGTWLYRMAVNQCLDFLRGRQTRMARATGSYDDDEVAEPEAPAPVIPAVFALGEALGSSGRNIVEAYVAGYEVTGKLVHSLRDSTHEGWHGPSTLGSFGAAAGCGSPGGAPGRLPASSPDGSRQNTRRCAVRGPRGGRFLPLLRSRRRAPVRTRHAHARSDGREQRASPARAGCVRGDFSVEFPARDLSRTGHGRARRGQCRGRETCRADAPHCRSCGSPAARGRNSGFGPSSSDTTRGCTSWRRRSIRSPG